MKLEHLLKDEKLSIKTLIAYTEYLNNKNNKKNKNIKKIRQHFSEKDKTIIKKGFKNNSFTQTQKKLIFQQLIQERVDEFNDVMAVNNQFEYIIHDFETRMNSDEFIEEIEIRNKKSILLEIKNPEDEKLNIFYEKIFYILVVLGIIFLIIIKLFNFYYKVHAVVFPFDPIPVFFNYWIINDFTFSFIDKIMLTLYTPSSYIIEKLIDYCIQYNIFF